MPVLTVRRNNYNNNPKSSTVYTPSSVARFLFNVLNQAQAHILDPAIGTGRLTDPWYEAGCHITGVDVVDYKPRCHSFHLSRYEDLERLDRPDLILCNPPFNGAPSKQLYPEVFLRHTFKLFGAKVPLILFTPMGLRLNQRKHSTRWRWLRDTKAQITSIITLPLNIFSEVEFHVEILVFNVKGVHPHYFLPEEALQ
jgi:type I restriction enzyme M protein